MLAFGLSSTNPQWGLDVVDSAEWTTDRPARTAQWSAVDRLVVDFDEPVVADAGSLDVTGAVSGPAALIGAGGSGTDRIIWNSAGRLGADSYALTLFSGPATAQDLAGNALDGEGPVGEFPSGDGDPGGDWSLELNVLPGDVTGDGEVNVFDLSILAINYGRTGVGPGEADFTGDGVVNVFDLAAVRRESGERPERLGLEHVLICEGLGVAAVVRVRGIRIDVEPLYE